MVMVKIWRESGEIDTEKCEHCIGKTAVRISVNGPHMTSKQLCADAGMCHASVDWEEVFNEARDGR